MWVVLVEREGEDAYTLTGLRPGTHREIGHVFLKEEDANDHAELRAAEASLGTSYTVCRLHPQLKMTSAVDVQDLLVEGEG